MKKAIDCRIGDEINLIFNTGSETPSLIDGHELVDWLKDGSISEGDLIYTVRIEKMSIFKKVFKLEDIPE